ncbi:glycosyltransferase family 39 protein [Candidatus Binatia bacterium]|nr:glycosyltransferase family 39 protein [Candidatus Binatia bacterium]
MRISDCGRRIREFRNPHSAIRNGLRPKPALRSGLSSRHATVTEVSPRDHLHYLLSIPEVRATLEALRALDRSPSLREFMLIAFAALVLLTVWVMIARLRATPAPRWPTVAFAFATAALTGSALVVRLAVSPRAFLHEGYWATWSYDYALRGNGGLYGSAGPAIYQAVEAVFGGMEQTIFLTNVVLAALTIPAVVALAWQLFRSVPSALLAGFVAALLPIHLRYSASEELWIPGTLFSLWSLAAFADWLSSQRDSSLAIASLALMLAIHSRPELLVLPAAVGLLLLLLAHPREWWRRIAGGAFAAWALLVGVVFVQRAAGALGSSYQFRGWLPLGSFWRSWIGSDPAITPVVLLFMLAAGMLYGAWHARRQYLWLLAVAFAFVELPLSVFCNEGTMLRTALLAMMLVAIAAAGAPLLLSVGAGWRFVPFAAAILAVAFAAGAWRNLLFVTTPTDEQLEHAFIGETLPLLPANARLIALHAPGFSTPPDWFDPFPRFLLERSPARIEFHQIPDVGVTEPWPEPAPNLFFYQGMTCHFSNDRSIQPAAPLRDRCLDIRRHYEMRPLRVIDIPGQPRTNGVYFPGPAGPFELGFFQIVGVRAPE